MTSCFGSAYQISGQNTNSYGTNVITMVHIPLASLSANHNAQTRGCGVRLTRHPPDIGPRAKAYMHTSVVVSYDRQCHTIYLIISTLAHCNRRSILSISTVAGCRPGTRSMGPAVRLILTARRLLELSYSHLPIKRRSNW